MLISILGAFAFTNIDKSYYTDLTYAYLSVLLTENELQFLPHELLYIPGIGKIKEFKLLNNENNKQICICQFIEKYNFTGSLIRYFEYDKNCNTLNKIFGDIIKI